jgi:hypothetical protein
MGRRHLWRLLVRCNLVVARTEADDNDDNDNDE